MVDLTQENVSCTLDSSGSRQWLLPWFRVTYLVQSSSPAKHELEFHFVIAYSCRKGGGTLIYSWMNSENIYAL